MTPCFALLHGGGQGSWVWEETAAYLRAGGARTILLDVPGCGVKRGRDISETSVADIADELLADLEEAGGEDIILVGHSLAGAILPLMAEKQPGRFRQIIYVSCTAPPPDLTILDQREERDAANPAMAEFLAPDADPSPQARYPAMFCNDMVPDDAAAFLAKLGQDHWPMAVFSHRDWRYDHLDRTPSTYILCERDQSLPLAWQREYAAQLHCGRTVNIDAGHQAMNTQAERLSELLLAMAREA